MDDDLSDNSFDPGVPFRINESLIPARETNAAGTITVSFNGLLKHPLLLREDLKEGCGGQLWPAGMVLAQYMIRTHHSDLIGKTMFVCSSELS
jgi:hypothetical protein